MDRPKTRENDLVPRARDRQDGRTTVQYMGVSSKTTVPLASNIQSAMINRNPICLDKGKRDRYATMRDGANTMGVHL